MKKLIKINILCLIFILLPFICNATYYNINVINDNNFNQQIGDFYVSSTNVNSGTGLNYEVVKFRPRGNSSIASAWDGSPLDQGPNFDVNVSDLWTFLKNNSIDYNVYSLVFGFDLNENGNNNFVIIDDLKISIGGNVFNLGNNKIQIYDWTGHGSNKAEASFKIDLSYDFMQQFNYDSIEDFSIFVTASNLSGGFEEFFLSADLTSKAIHAPVPEPSTIIMLLFGLFTLYFFKMRKNEIK